MKQIFLDSKTGEIVSPPKQSAKQRALWLTSRFSSKENTLEHIDQVIEIFMDEKPPLTADYWRAVKTEVEALKDW